MKNLLIIANADSVFVKQYCENLVKLRKYNIYVLTRSNKVFDYFYERQKITIIHYIRDYSRGKEKLHRFLIRTVHEVRARCNGFDLIHVHYIDRVVLTLAKVLATERTKVVVSYWGSDIYRKEDETFIKEEKALLRADNITFITEEMRQIFRQKYGTQFDDKLYMTLE